MQELLSMIDSLDSESRNLFESQLLLRGHKRPKGKIRKDVLLFRLLSKEKLFDESLTLRIYREDGAQKRNAFHALKKRLKSDLRRFIVEQEAAESAQSVEGWIIYGRYLFDHNFEKLAWKALKKAEKLAKNEELNDKLDEIYNCQLAHCHLPGAPALSQIEKKKEANRTRIAEDDRILLASANIKLQFLEVKLSGSDVDLQERVNDIMERYHLHDAVQRRPQVMFEFVSLVRSAFVARKDFLNLEPFLAFHAERLFQKEDFTSRHPQLKGKLLYFLAHTYYRNRNFHASLAMIELLLSEIRSLKKRYQADLYPRAILLKAAVKSFSGRNQEAVNLLQEAAEDPFFKKPNSDRLNLRLNLAVYFFQQNDYKSANRLLFQMPNTDNWCEKTMGQEWMMKRAMIEMITQVEMGNTEIALNRIRSIQRKYKKLLNYPRYHQVRPFLQVVKSVISYPERVNAEMFDRELKPKFVIRNVEEEDLQAMSYFAWLKSKYLQEPYYHTLLEIVNG